MATITDDELLGIEPVSSEASTTESTASQPVEEENRSEASRYLGTTLNHKPGENLFSSKEETQKLIEEKNLTRIGEKLTDKMSIREGWIPVDSKLLGERAIFYPEDWTFMIRPATVEAIRNWSTIDDENIISMDDVFNEVIKSCVSINTPAGPLPWGNICSWDRFFFLLLIREYTFVHGEKAIKYEEDCIECENPVTFELTSQSIMYEVPDPAILRYYDRQTRSWRIDPEEYDVDAAPITLYVPTLEKDANIKAWLIARVQENRNRKIDNVFIKFAPWLSQKISKDADIAKKQIRELEMIYKSWDIDMFGFMDEVVNNIAVVPSQKLMAVCPTCGEEVTSPIRFPGSVRDIFNISSKRKKFG